MENKYMTVNSAPQFTGAQMNQHAMMRQNMTAFAAFGAKPTPAPKPVKKNGLKEGVKKYWPLVVVAGVVGLDQYKKNKDAPAPNAP